MKRILCAILAAAAVLCGCSVSREPELKKYNATFLNLFDTVTTVVGYASDEAEFTAVAQQVHDALLEYHQLFDVYNDYEGLNNLKTINDNAGAQPVEVDSRIVDLLLDCRDYYDRTEGRVNVAMGSVLLLWHEARNEGIEDFANARLPDASALTAAAEHMSPECIVIDREASTVFLTDPEARLDVGAVAKGWALQRVCEQLPAGLLISVGGNVCSTGVAESSGASWVIGVTNPDGGDYLHTIYLDKGSVVTSGDYQRAYMVDGEMYHHIIDPDTLYPSTYWSSVTIVCEDSGLADALSTALFLLPREEGQAILTACGAEALWVDRDGNMFYSPGFEKLIRT